MRNFGSPHQGDDDRNAGNRYGDSRPSQSSQGQIPGAVSFHRNVYDFHGSPLSSPRVVVTGESDQHAGSRGAYSNTRADSVIRLPTITSRSADSRPLPDALFIRSEAPFEGSYLLQASVDVIAASFWIAYFLLWFGTLGALIFYLFVDLF